MGHVEKVRLSVRLSLETPEDAAILSALSEVPPGRRNRWLRTRILIGCRSPENGKPLPEPKGRGQLLRVDLYGDSPEERALIERARRDFYPGRTLRECLLRGGRVGSGVSGSPALPEGSDSFEGGESAVSPSFGSLKERLRGLL